MKCKIKFNPKRACMLYVFLLFTAFNIWAVKTYELQQDGKTITGIVTDGTTNLPLPGVTVLIKGSTTGTVTDGDGNYSILASENNVIQFSYIGYLTEEIQVGDKTKISVSLIEDIIGLEEVVVTGYGVQQKSDLTGSISSVSGEKITEVPVTGIDHALQGRAAGVHIIPKTGRPGQGVTIQIRGVTSINGTDPLIIVDGVVGSLEGVNPNDIESIEVLKDASSAAIYGSSGGNGVIILTTKTGRQGKIRTSFNYYKGIEESVGRVDLMNSQEWMEVNEEIDYRNTTPITYMPDTLKTYDWQDYLFRQASIENYNIAIDGGTEKSTFLISSSYSTQEGIIKPSDYRRFTMRINSDYRLTDRITFDEKISYVSSAIEGFEEWYWHGYYQNPIMPTLQMAPNIPAYDENGDWSISQFGGTSPLVQLDMQDRVVHYNDFDANLGLKIDLLKGLTFMSRFYGKLGFTDMKEFQDTYNASPTDSRTVNHLMGNMSRSLSYNAQQFLTYNTAIVQDHNITLMAGMEARRWWGYDLGGERVDMPSNRPELLYFDLSINKQSAAQIIEGTGYEERAMAYFGRLNYDYKKKYLLTANIRHDGSSNFGPANRFGTFPSFSVGWKFTEEEFMSNQDIISFGKIRFGYGQTGANARSGYPYLSLIRTPGTFTYPIDNQASLIGAAPVQITNAEIHWESVNMSNIGLDIGFFRNRLTLTAEYFKKINDGMLMLMNVPTITGSYSEGAEHDDDETEPEVNIGSIQNKGFEFTMVVKKMEGDLKGSFDINFSTAKNKVLDLASDSIVDGRVHNVLPVCLTRIGGSVSEFYGFEMDGIFRETDPTRVIGSRTVIINQPFSVSESGDTTYAQSRAVPGDARYKDINGDGVLTNEDKKPLGSPLPKVIFGFSVNLEYKGFDMSAFFNGTIGNKIFNGMKQYLYYSQGYGNRAKEFVNRYRDEIVKDGVVVVHENHNTDLWRMAAVNYTRVTDWYVEDGSYIRLRNLTLGYTIPAKFTNIVNINKLRFFIGAKNLFTITSYTGFNPEVGDRTLLDMGIDYGIYPVTRTYLFGANLEF